MEQFLLRCRDASEEELKAGSVRGELQLRHRYLEDPIAVEVTPCLAGEPTAAYPPLRYLPSWRRSDLTGVIKSA